MEYQALFQTTLSRLDALEKENDALKTEVALATTGLATAVITIRNNEKSSSANLNTSFSKLDGKMKALAKTVSANDSTMRGELGRLHTALKK